MPRQLRLFLGGLGSFNGRFRTLHLTWFAFFLVFVVWYNFAPLTSQMRADLILSENEIRTMVIANVGLTIPARIVCGMLVDRYGPKVVMSGLLIFSAVPALWCALTQDYTNLMISRLGMSIVGAGFVVGIRMISEWFPQKEIGASEGVYGGWGNAGSTFSTMVLPFVAIAAGSFLSPPAGWRVPIAATGIAAAAYGVFYYFNLENTPPGQKYEGTKSVGGQEVTTQKDFWLMAFMYIPPYVAMGVVAWRFVQVQLIDQSAMVLCWSVLAGFYLLQVYGSWQVNRELMMGQRRYPPQERYKFTQVVCLQLAYMATIGAAFSIVSVLPLFFEKTFKLPTLIAGMVAGLYSAMNLFSRPGGGILSDLTNKRKLTLVVLLAVMGVSLLCMNFVGKDSPLPLAIALSVGFAIFVQAAGGATFAIVPLVKRRITGQISGTVGAYSNVGSITYLTIFSLAPQGDAGNKIFFSTMGICGLIAAFFCLFFLEEPQPDPQTEPVAELQPQKSG